MGKKRIGINGFGRIGRLVFRNLQNRPDVEVVAINDLTDNAELAHLLKYDTAHGRFNGEVALGDESIVVNGKEIKSYGIRNPEEIPWGKHDVDVVLECTGIFRKREQAEMHIKAGAKKVIISAPAKSDDVKTIVLGVNEEILNADDIIISNASCTTNCLAPVVDIINKNWGMKHAYMTTTHAYTGAQNIQDGPNNRDWRRGRAAAQNIVPTSTGSAKAIGIVIPEVDGKIKAMAIRVPVITGSLIEFIVHTEKEVTVEEVNAKFKSESEGRLKNILEYQTDPIVSSDIISDPNSCIFDSLLTEVNDGHMLKVVAWYDNEGGYSARLADLAEMV